MEVPLDSSELNKIHAWKESISNKRYADLLKMLNYRTPFRDFLQALSEVWHTPPEGWIPKNPSDPNGSIDWNWKHEIYKTYIQPNFITSINYKSVEDMIRDYGEGGYPKTGSARIEGNLVYISSKLQYWNEYMHSHSRYGEGKGLMNPVRGPWANARQIFKDYVLTLLSNDYLNNKKASYKNLLDGNLIYKLNYMTNPIDAKIRKGNKLIVDIKYLQPISPKDFKYSYTHRDNQYWLCKNGRLYQYLNLEIEILLEDQTISGKPIFDEGIKIIERGGLTIKNLGEHSSFKPTYVFIPDREVGREHAEGRGKLLGSVISELKSTEVQHIDVLKRTNRINYLDRKLDLDYFGDLQGYKIKYLEDIDIAGYNVKSPPMHYINWLINNNPLEVKE